MAGISKEILLPPSIAPLFFSTKTERSKDFLQIDLFFEVKKCLH
jgi:hypothetical protein